MAPHSSTLVWKISWTEKPGRLQSMELLRVGMTERLHFHFSLSCIGEGNGNPLQCSCLENPRDEGAWWTAIYGVAQSRTQLKRLSSSSSKVLQRQYSALFKSTELRDRCVRVLICFSCVRLFVTLWTVACQAPLSMGFSKQEYWSELPCSPPGNQSDLGIKPHLLCLLHWQAGSLPLVSPGKLT